MADSIPKLRVPIEMGTHGFRTVEQDSDDEVAACVYAVVATPLMSRVEEPMFGVEDPTFETLPLNVTEWIDQIARFEPRAEVATVQDIERELTRVGVLEQELGGVG